VDRRVDQIATSVVMDTCAVWNVLSSAILHRACREAKFAFALTGFVLYECLSKPRSSLKPHDDRLKARLRDARARGEFVDVNLTVDDLLEVGRLEGRRRLSMGELSSIAFALRAGMAFQTDDQKARKLASSVMPADRVQTTPHVLGWLFFVRRLVDGDFETILFEHAECEGPLKPYLTEMYTEALRCRLMMHE
jgi:hypothetical protein